MGAANIAYKNPSDIDLTERLAVFGIQEGDRPSLEHVATLITSGKIKRIICLCGAGISVSAGIPDFRSEGTGLYHNLQKYNLDKPESMFDIEFFKSNPKPFIHLAKELFPGQYDPTTTHHFLRLLDEKGLLLRVYTQNIDGLEFQAGLSENKVIQCHGGFQKSHCIECGQLQDNETIKRDIMAGVESRCTHCDGLCKPAITFFGEKLPQKYWDAKGIDFCRYENQCAFKDCENPTIILLDGKRSFYCREHNTNGSVIVDDELIQSKDCKDSVESKQQEDADNGPISCQCDLLLVLGTSLSVAPVSGLVDDVHWLCPRVLINREKVHCFGEPRPDWPPALTSQDNGFRFDCEDNYRDVDCVMNCDEAAMKLASLLGWEEDLKELMSMPAMSSLAEDGDR